MSVQRGSHLCETAEHIRWSRIISSTENGQLGGKKPLSSLSRFTGQVVLTGLLYSAFINEMADRILNILKYSLYFVLRPQLVLKVFFSVIICIA